MLEGINVHILALTDTEIDEYQTKEISSIVNESGTYTAYYTVSDIPLDQAQLLKKRELRKNFDDACVEPVLYNGNYWHGGYDSALKLDGAKRLAELAGSAYVQFSDVDDVLHTLTIADATLVVLAVADDYQQKFVQKQTLYAYVDAASTTAEVKAITW